MTESPPHRHAVRAPARAFVGVLVTALCALAAVSAAGCAGGDTDPGKDSQVTEANAEDNDAGDGPHAHTNALIHESSPYLLQHAHNPVDWLPWGPEAFEKARAEDKPIFLSIGYSTCHWCHVMERESFENEDIAELLNRWFVPVKVDREERPDVDAVYMQAVVATTGRGGWPMSVFLTPDGKPFHGGTYYPRPTFARLLEEVHRAWTQDRDKVVEGAAGLTEHLRTQTEQAAAGGDELPSEEALQRGRDQLHARFDRRTGGFGNAPKFPTPHNLLHLLRHHAHTGDAESLRMVETTLDHMARGGIHDHLGGGFHRYSVDAEWLVPHFEKMLYDQALLLRAYVEAWQVTGDERWARTARDIVRWITDDMTDERGGFHSARDADSEGEEGKVYVWTLQELTDVLGEEDARLFGEAYGVSASGNWTEEATGEPTHTNILHLPRPLADVAADRDMTEAELRERLAPLRDRLLEARAERVQAAKDDKVLADWNGLMIWALAHAGAALDEPEWVAAAERAADFIWDEMRTDGGDLLHRWRDGRAGIPAFLEDHAYLGLGLLGLYEAGWNVEHLRRARTLADAMVEKFGADDGTFTLASADGPGLVVATKEIYDGATPSGNSAAMVLLLRLGRLLQDDAMMERGRAALAAFGSTIEHMSAAHTFALRALALHHWPVHEVVLSGPADHEDMQAMRRILARRYTPGTVSAHRPPGDDPAIAELVPFAAVQTARDGLPTAYVCENYACNLPVTDPEAFADLLPPVPAVPASGADD